MYFLGIFTAPVDTSFLKTYFFLMNLQLEESKPEIPPPLPV
uniref:Uncharacterized protein n=1 Tax=Anguilla anguilla TaxID=7936 RepID=A0A0E9R5G8_ANGAN